MKILQNHISGLLTIEPSVFEDDRGYFLESFNTKTFEEATGVDVDFVQDNESMSNKGVLRGLHFQVPPYAQDKLVRVVRGSVIDVAVDLRHGSPTFGEYAKVLLSAKNRIQFFVPKGFAHGFAVLEDQTIFSYKCSEFYHRDSERSLKWNDPAIAINWEIDDPILSQKDKETEHRLEDFTSTFLVQ
ncbi:dTDP-4-dehydrorhamnose 3,5-epimerase [Cryomorphaceae bacterium 1068]|nr:dTDP-4-dehydrorhamnose 3,5-epimerase [Cryomorphaceae bacterium 1068]